MCVLLLKYLTILKIDSIVLFGGNVEQFSSGNFEGNCSIFY